MKYKNYINGIMTNRIIKCNGECEGCIWEWRNAQYNPDCFLSELLDFIDRKSKKVKVK